MTRLRDQLRAGWCRWRNHRSSTTWRTNAGAASRRRPTAAPSPRARPSRARPNTPGSEARAETLRVRLEPLPRVVAARLDGRGGRQQTRFDRRPDAFAALRIGEAGRVADQHHAGIDDAPVRRVVDGIRVPAPARSDVTRESCRWPSRNARKSAVALGSDRRSRRPRPTLRYSPFPEAPAVALEVAAEVQLGRLALRRAHGVGVDSTGTPPPARRRPARRRRVMRGR